MPISSFHGLRKNSVPTQPWNCTRSSPQRGSPTGTRTRKRSVFGVPQLWSENEFEDEGQDDAKYLKNNRSPVVTHTQKSYGKTSRKSSVNSRPNSARQERWSLKRRETFPKFMGETYSPRTAAKDLRRSKTDPSIVPDKKARRNSSKPLKRPTTLWNVGKKEDRSSTKFRKRKINNSSSSPSFYSPDGSLDNDFSRKRLSQGDKVVCILNKKPQLGILKYIGTTHFADGEWCGILLDEPCGKNDGSVRGVRYFRCRNKHGIFVHSHKVKRADETTLSRLNLLEGFSSPESSEKREKGGIDSKPRMASSEVEIVNGDRKIYKHRDVKSLRLTKRNRSVSLDRFLFQKTKQVAKSLNIFIHNPDNGDKVDIRDRNRMNRSVSLPKIEKENVYDSNEYCLVDGMAPLGKGKFVVDAKKGSISNGEQNIYSKSTNKTGVPRSEKEDTNSSRKSNKVEVTCSENSYSDDSLEKSKDCDANTGQNMPSGGTVVHKVGHAVSLDTHLLIENGKLPVTTNGVDDEFSCQSRLANKEDPFIQGRHCSCPSLHCADHFSEAITTCLDLGRTDRSVIYEVSGETDANLETVQVTGISSHRGIHSHSQSEVLEKLFQNAKVARSTSSSSKQAERKGSWPWLTSTPKQSLRSYGSCDDINTSGTIGKEDVFDEGFSSVLAHAKLISTNIADKHFKLDHSGSISNNGDIISESKKVDSMPTRSVDGDSNYADSLSGSQASLSSTGTSDSKGKKMSSKKRIPISAKSSGSKPKRVSTSGLSAPKVTTKQSRLEQIRQQQQNRNGALPSTDNKSQLADKAVAENKNGSKIAKRHTLATISDLKSSVPRPSVNKRPMSDAVAGTAEKSNKEEVKSKLPVKKMSSPQFLRPAALSKTEKATDAATSVQRRHSAAVSRPPAASTVKRNSSMAQSDSKSSKPSIAAQKSKGKEKELSVVGQKVAGVQTPSATTGPKGGTAPRPKPQTSQVTRSSSSVKAKGPPAKEAKNRPAPVSSNKKPAQTVKQTTKQTPPSQKQGTSKLPRKVSGQLSNASDSVSVTSSIKDQDNLEDLHDPEIDTVSVSTDTSDHDKGVPSQGHFQQDEIDAKVNSPIEGPCRIMPPDILSETPYLSKHSVGVQVDDDSDLKTIQALKEKGRHLHELVKQRTDLCWQLQDQIDEDSIDFVAASVMILSVVRKLQWCQKYTNQLQRKIESTTEEMNVIQERLAEEEANSVKLQEEMMYQSSEHAVAIETLKADYENVLERTSNELKTKHQGEIMLALETHKAQVHEMRQHQEKEMSELKKSHEELLASLKEEHRDEVVELESKHSSVIDELVEEHQVEIETIKGDYDEQQSDFKDKYDKVASECSTLNKKLQQLQDQSQKDIETRIQEAIKKYESLPAEIESIKAVLEMKNEEIKQLRKEKMEKHLELEKLEAIKDETKKLQHENESLSFVVETKSRFERQLSVERDTLRNSLERESAKSKRLSLENEELQWRLVNSTSPPGTPTDDDRPLSASNRNSFRLSATFPDVEPIDE